MYASRLLGGKLNESATGIWQKLGIPFVTNLSFAAEMYLKALEFEETGNRPDFDHNLMSMFDRLSDESKTWIHKQWEKRCRAELAARREAMGNPKHFPKNMRGMLTQAALAFVDWRYPDGNTILDFNLGEFPELVRERILICRPEWGPGSPDHMFRKAEV